MFRKLSLQLILLFCIITVNAQIYDPVSWKFSYEKKGDCKYELVFTATIENGFHIYSLDVPGDGPVPTSFSFDENDAFTLDGEVFEVTAPESVFDKAFGFNVKSFSGRAEFRQRIVASKEQFTVTGMVESMACNNVTCSPPKEVTISMSIGSESVKAMSSSVNPVGGKGHGKGMIGFFFASFLLGLLGVLTPCVYPMIPFTVAFFSRNNANKGSIIKNALAFGLSIIVIYTSPGLIISLTGAGAGFANTLSTHWIPNLIFFLLFVVFALSFFGAFEITLPNKWASSADSRVDRGGVFASFFMALTTVIVSFSCTGPIVGSLLVEAVRGDVLRPTIGMFAFGLAFSIPFTLLALSPSIIQKLPKSGNWMNTLKVILGVLMLAFSLKFIVTIDSVYSLHLFPKEVFLLVWIAVFVFTGLYLIGAIRLFHEKKTKKKNTARMVLAVIDFLFVIYLVSGIFGNPLKGIAAIMPAEQLGWFSKDVKGVDNQGVTDSKSPFVFRQINSTSNCSTPIYNDIFKMPYGLSGYFEFEQGLACAKEQNKPVLIDFKGHACANCKRMEAGVWSDPEVLKILKDNFVIIALYADDRTPLPESKWVVSSVDGKTKKTIGKVNEDIEISHYNTNALPYYIIAGHDGKPLITPMTTNMNVDEYIEWLKKGLAAFKN